MDNTKQPLKLLVCTPITAKLGKQAETEKLKAVVAVVEETALERGATIRCAFKEEIWRGREKPEIFVLRDLGWSRECDGAVIIPEKSYGVRIEEGWLSAFGKPFVRLHENTIKRTSDLERHLGFLVPVFDRVFATSQDIVLAVSEFIDFLKSKAATALILPKNW